jgi:hypothetical protein
MLRKTGLNQSLEGCRKDKNKRRESLNSAYWIKELIWQNTRFTQRVKSLEMALNTCIYFNFFIYKMLNYES